jgi:hypothetical protein
LKFQNGEVLSVGRHTLTKYSDFANSFSHLSAEGSHLVDRDPEAFKFLLNYIRSDKKLENNIQDLHQKELNKEEIEYWFGKPKEELLKN